MANCNPRHRAGKGKLNGGEISPGRSHPAGAKASAGFDFPAGSSHHVPVRVLNTSLRSAARWLAVAALVFHIAWLPLHLLTETHCDAGPANPHAQAHTEHHGHSDVQAGAPHSHAPDHHHYTADHESKFLAKRQALLQAPVLVVWQPLELTPPALVVWLAGLRVDAGPPPADFPPPSCPRAPPRA
jgi:hypothetical protein